MERRERIELCIKKLREAPPAASYQGVRSLLEETLNQIEDLHSGVPYNPDAWKEDRRLYPPADDYELRSPYEGIRVFRTLGHYVLFGSNGAIKIVSSKAPL